MEAQALAAKIAVIATRHDCPHTIQAELLKLVIEATTRQGAEEGSVRSSVTLEIKKARDKGMTISEVAELLSLTPRQVRQNWPHRARMTDDIILKIFMLSDEGRKNKHVAAELGLADTTVSKVLHGNHPLIERGGK